jgi:hypothetical protein
MGILEAGSRSRIKYGTSFQRDGVQGPTEVNFVDILILNGQ